MNPTEILLSHARDDIDRRLIEFGYDPWQVESHQRLTTEQKLTEIRALTRFVHRVRTSDARRSA